METGCSQRSADPVDKQQTPGSATNELVQDLDNVRAICEEARRGDALDPSAYEPGSASQEVAYALQQVNDIAEDVREEARPLLEENEEQFDEIVELRSKMKQVKEEQYILDHEAIEEAKKDTKTAVRERNQARRELHDFQAKVAAISKCESADDLSAQLSELVASFGRHVLHDQTSSADASVPIVASAPRLTKKAPRTSVLLAIGAGLQGLKYSFKVVALSRKKSSGTGEIEELLCKDDDLRVVQGRSIWVGSKKDALVAAETLDPTRFKGISSNKAGVCEIFV